MEEAKIIRFLIRRITFFRNLIFILDGSEVEWKILHLLQSEWLVILIILELQRLENLSKIKVQGFAVLSSFKAEAIQGLYECKNLTPNDGVLAPLTKHLLESMMDGEQENQLNEEKASGNSNRRNGNTKKTVWGFNTGTFELETGRDRSGTFEPKIVQDIASMHYKLKGSLPQNYKK